MNPLKELGIDREMARELGEEDLKIVVSSSFKGLSKIYHPDIRGRESQKYTSIVNAFNELQNFEALKRAKKHYIKVDEKKLLQQKEDIEMLVGQNDGYNSLLRKAFSIIVQQGGIAIDAKRMLIEDSIKFGLLSSRTDGFPNQLKKERSLFSSLSFEDKTKTYYQPKSSEGIKGKPGFHDQKWLTRLGGGGLLLFEKTAEPIQCQLPKIIGTLPYKKLEQKFSKRKRKWVHPLKPQGDSRHNALPPKGYLLWEEFLKVAKDISFQPKENDYLIKGFLFEGEIRFSLLGKIMGISK